MCVSRGTHLAVRLRTLPLWPGSGMLSRGFRPLKALGVSLWHCHPPAAAAVPLRQGRDKPLSDRATTPMSILPITAPAAATRVRKSRRARSVHPRLKSEPANRGESVLPPPIELQAEQHPYRAFRSFDPAAAAARDGHPLAILIRQQQGPPTRSSGSWPSWTPRKGIPIWSLLTSRPMPRSGRWVAIGGSIRG
jgi:hypothetical protein